MFELSYTLTFEDYKAFLTALRNRQRGRKLRTGMLYFGLFVVFMAAIAVINGTKPSDLLTLEGLSPLIVMGLFYVLFLRFAMPRLWRRNFKAQKIGLYPITLTANQQRLGVEQNGVRTNIEWSRLEEIASLPDQLLLWIGPIQSLIVPLNAFANNKEAEAFTVFVKAKMNDPI